MTPWTTAPISARFRVAPATLVDSAPFGPSIASRVAWSAAFFASRRARSAPLAEDREEATRDNTPNGLGGGAGAAAFDFGSSTTFNSDAAFASSPSFDSITTFGSSAAFGASATFNSGAAFGSSPTFASMTPFGSSAAFGFGTGAGLGSGAASRLGSIAAARLLSTTVSRASWKAPILAKRRPSSPVAGVSRGIASGGTAPSASSSAGSSSPWTFGGAVGGPGGVASGASLSLASFSICRQWATFF